MNLVSNAAPMAWKRKRRETESFPRAKGRALQGVPGACTETKQTLALEPPRRRFRAEHVLVPQAKLDRHPN
jgi:hypothetical protein